LWVEEETFMKQKYSTVILALILLMVATLPATHYQYVQSAYRNGRITRNVDFEVAQGPPAEMKLPVTEDEAVASNLGGTNLDGNENQGGLFVGYESIDGWSRSWLKFNLTFLPENMGIVSATFNAYLNAEWNNSADGEIGLYHSENNTWKDDMITWDNQPAFAADPMDSISPPYDTSVQRWHSWDVTTALLDEFQGDRILSLLLKQVSETGTDETWEYFVEKEYDQINSSYIAIQYTLPETHGLQVDGFDSSPQIDYIQNSTPTLSWTSSDSGSGYMQMSYEVEVWNNQYFNDTMLFEDKTGDIQTLYGAGATANTRPFASDIEFRFQFKYPSSLLPRSGLVDKLYFGVEDDSGTAIFEDLEILIASTLHSGELEADYSDNYNDSSPIQVLNRQSYEADMIGGWMVFDVENHFYSNVAKNLVIELRFTNNTGTLTRSFYTSGAGGSVAYGYGDGASFESTATYLYDRTHNLKIEYASDVVFEAGYATPNDYPFGTEIGEPGILQLMYNASMIQETGVIDRLFFGVDSLDSMAVFEGLTVKLAETPHEGELSHTDFSSNYAGVEPTTVLDEEWIQLANLAGSVVLDIEDTFTYSGAHNLLIEITWDSLLEQGPSIFRVLDAGGYRSWNLTWLGLEEAGNDTRTYDLQLQFVHDDTGIVYDGAALTNNTQYYWRVRTMDTTGVWSEWTTQSFTYAVVTSAPEFSGLTFEPEPGVVGEEATVSVDVTYFLGVEAVWFEIDGSNHSMTASGDTYSYSWIPAESANFTYTIYMESTAGTTSTTSGSFEVVEGSGLFPDLPIDKQTLLLIVIGILILVIVILAVRRR
jgi:hypothetical protein